MSEGERAISSVLGVTDSASNEDATKGKAANNSGLDSGKLNDGNPVMPNDGAGTRSISIAQAELDLIKIRSRK
jgi:hypothetical protein